MKDMAIQLDEEFECHNVPQEAYLEQKTQYKAQYIVLTEKFNQAMKQKIVELGCHNQEN